MLKQKFVLHFITGIGLQIITSLTGIIVARLAGPEVIGTVAYGTAYVGLFGFTLGLFGSSHLKLISEGRNFGNCITTYTILQSINIGLFIGIFLLYNFFHNTFIKSDFSQVQIYVIWVFFGFYVISQFIGIMQITFSAKIDVAKGSLSLILQNIAYNATRILVVVLGLGAVVLTAANYVGLLFTIPITWYYFKNYPIGRFDRKLTKEYLKLSIPFFIIGICSTGINNLGRILLEYFDNVKQIGLYTAGYSIASILFLISSTTGTIFFPLFSKQISENQFELIKVQIYKYERFILQFVLPLVIIIAIYSNFIIELLLGNKYSESGQILKILIVSSFIRIFFIPHGNLLVGMRLYKIVSYLNIAQLVFFVISLLFFLPKNLLGMGAAGLASSTLSISILLAVMYYYFIQKTTNINTIKKEHILIFLWGSLIGVTIYFIKNYLLFNLSSIIILIIGSSMILLLFYSVLYYFNLISSKDFSFFFSLFNIKKVTEYVKAETKK